MPSPLSSQKWQQLTDTRVGNRDCNEDDSTDDHLEGKRGDAHEIEAVLGDGDEEYAEHAAEHRALPSPETCPAKNDCGKNVEFTSIKCVGHHLLGIVCLYQTADACHHAEPSEGDELHRPDIDSEAACPSGLSPKA